MNIVCLFTEERISHWKRILCIDQWTIFCETISEMQVTDELEEHSIGHEFVGVERNFNEQQAIIYHTRQLQEDDIVHELLHIRYPDWSEDKVEYWTSLLLGERVIQLENDMQLLLPTG